MTQAEALAAQQWRALLRTPAALALAACAAGLLWRLYLFLTGAADAVAYPGELDYGEGIVWHQMREILAGRGYAPIDGFPTIVFHYTPVYHLVTGAAARLGGFDELATGRAVSVAATLVAALFAGLVAGRITTPATRAARLACGLAAGLIVVSCWPIAQWGWLMRVDMVAYAFALAGLYLAMAALERGWLIHLAALAFVAALFAKQNMVAAPAAAFSVLLVLRPRLAIAGLATSASTGLAVLAALTAATHGEFLRHAFLYNVNRFALRDAWITFRWVTLQQGAFVVLAIYGARFVLQDCLAATRGASGLAEARTRLANDPRVTGGLIALAYLVITQAMAPLAGKSGANFNYLIEWLMAVSIFAGVCLGPTARAAFPAPGAPPLKHLGWVLVVIAPLAIVFQTAYLRRPEPDLKVRTPAQAAQYAQLSLMVRAASKPVISDDMVLLLQNHKAVVWEPAIFAELASTGFYDQQRIIRMIDDQAFAFFVTNGDRGYILFDKRYNPPVSAAMARRYPCKIGLARLLVHLPAEACAPRSPPVNIDGGLTARR